MVDKTKKQRPEGAAHVIAGFRYQLLQSLAAWMELRGDEELWLEVSEDFSISNRDTTTDVQVKSSQAAAGPPSYSLHSTDVLNTLRRFWARSDEGRANRRVIFLAQGGVATERDHEFPDGVAGLHYWRMAALDADTAPLRKVLAALFQGEGIAEWIARGPTDEELRSRLLRRVQWATEAKSSDDLQLHLREQVSLLLLAQGMPVLAGNPAFSALLDRAFETASKPKPQERRLRSLDLHRAVEETVVAMGLGRAIVGASHADPTEATSVLVNNVEEPLPTFAQRAATVEEILEGATGHVLLWLHGSHGVGKSTLARLIARKIGGRWLALDLRAVQADPTGSLAAWRDLMRVLATTPPPDGIIIDDLASAAMEILRPRIGALARILEARGARVVVTSPQAPSPARMFEVGAGANAAVRAPYFTKDDVAELINAAPAPPDLIEAWAAFIWIASGGGHPLLTAAKVSSLRARHWPRDALVEDFLGSTSEAVRTTRDEARQALLRELSTVGAAHSMDAGQLLRRVGSVFDRVDDALAQKLAVAEPSLSTGGDVLAVLRGTWLELLPGGGLRISPLLSDVISDVPPEDLKRWRRIAAEHWLGTRTLNERTLPLCFWNALGGEHSGVLMTLCYVLQSLPRERLLGAASLLSFMTALVTDRPFYTANALIGVQLRLLQFEVADAVEEAELAGKIASRLLLEFDDLPDDDIRALLTTVAGHKVLVAEIAKVAPADRLEFALRVRVAKPRAVALGKGGIADPNLMLQAEFGAKVDFASFLFSTIIRHIGGSADELEIIRALDDLAPDERNGFVDAMDAIYKGHSVFINSGWSRDQTEGRDMAVALNCYEEISEVVARWKRPDLMVELACAKSVILDEGLERVDDAIAVVDAAVSAFGAYPSLARQKSKVLGHAGRDGEATDLLLSVEDEVGRDSPLERALALRDGAVSAARVARFADSVRLFSKAHDALLNSVNSGALRTGLLVEKALSLWEWGQRADAIIAAGDSLDAVAEFPPTESRQAERAHQFARAILGLFLRDLEPFQSKPRPPITIGLASSLDSGSEKLLDLDLKPLSDNWRLLALVEAQAEVDVGINARSVAKQTGPRILSIEHLIGMARYAHALKSDQLPHALRMGAAATTTMIMLRELTKNGDPLGRTEDLDTPPDNFNSLLTTTDGREAVQRLSVDTILCHQSFEALDGTFLTSLQKASLEVFGDNDVIDAVLKAASGLYAVGPEAPFSVAVAGAISISTDAIIGNPQSRFHRDLMTVGHIANSLAQRVLMPIAALQLHEGWTTVLRDQSFLLRNPSRHGPAIEAALARMMATGFQDAAALLLAAAPAVGYELTDGWQRFLQRTKVQDDAKD